MRKINLIWMIWLALLASAFVSAQEFAITSYSPINNSEITLINHNDGFGGYSYSVFWNKTANCSGYINDSTTLFSVFNQPAGISIPNNTLPYTDAVISHNTTCISEDSDFAESFVVYTFWANETYPPYISPDFLVEFILFPEHPFANSSLITFPSPYNETNVQINLNANLSSELYSINNCWNTLYLLNPNETLIDNQSASGIPPMILDIDVYPLNQTGVLNYRDYTQCNSNQSPFYSGSFVEFSVEIISMLPNLTLPYPYEIPISSCSYTTPQSLIVLFFLAMALFLVFMGFMFESALSGICGGFFMLIMSFYTAKCLAGAGIMSAVLGMLFMAVFTFMGLRSGFKR